MKKIVLLLVIILSSFISADAIGIKLYVGSAKFDDKQSTKFFLQLIVCNNNEDTLYIKRDDLDNIYPRLTTDVSVIADGGSYFLLNNVTNLVTDKDRMLKMVTDRIEGQYEQTTEMQHKLYAENNKLPQRTMNGIKYYVFAPNKCLTVNCVTQTAVYEFLKLADVTEEQQKPVEVYLTLGIWYHTFLDDTKRSDLLIARPSEDLKKCVFLNNKPE